MTDVPHELAVERSIDAPPSIVCRTVADQVAAAEA